MTNLLLHFTYDARWWTDWWTFVAVERYVAFFFFCCGLTKITFFFVFAVDFFSGDAAYILLLPDSTGLFFQNLCNWQTSIFVKGNSSIFVVGVFLWGFFNYSFSFLPNRAWFLFVWWSMVWSTCTGQCKQCRDTTGQHLVNCGDLTVCLVLMSTQPSQRCLMAVALFEPSRHRLKPSLLFPPNFLLPQRKQILTLWS